MILICQRRFINNNRCTFPMGVQIMGSLCMWKGKEVHGKPLYLPLNVTMNFKLLSENNVFFKNMKVLPKTNAE